MTKLNEEKGEGKKCTPLRAIRAKCLDCVLGSSNEVALCPMENKCALWPFRFGKNPNVKLSDEERERRRRLARENLAFTLKVKDTSFEGVSDGRKETGD
jgi:hypothetical protein